MYKYTSFNKELQNNIIHYIVVKHNMHVQINEDRMMTVNETYILRAKILIHYNSAQTNIVENSAKQFTEEISQLKY